jgi:hypothetical protein
MIDLDGSVDLLNWPMELPATICQYYGRARRPPKSMTGLVSQALRGYWL